MKRVTPLIAFIWILDFLTEFVDGGLQDLILVGDPEMNRTLVLDQSTGDISSIAVSRYPVSVDLDPIEGKVYWADWDDGFIKRSNLDGNSVEVLWKDKKSMLQGIRIDPLSRLIYFVERFSRTIKVMNLTGHHLTDIVVGNMAKPRGLALHPVNGYLYWTDWGNAPRPKIERANMDGTKRLTLVQGENLGTVNDIEIDFTDDRLYWCNNRPGIIQMADLYGKDQRTLTADRNDCRDFGVRGKSVYLASFTKTNRHKIISYDKDTGEGPFLVSDRFSAVRCIATQDYNYYMTGISTKCGNKNGGCSALCLPTPTGCTCTDGGVCGRDCDSNPCKNGATCKEQRNGNMPYACECRKQYKGLNCEIELKTTSKTEGTTSTSTASTTTKESACARKPCRNGGACYESEGGFMCRCPITHTGRRCHREYNPCNRTPCKNGATCIRHVTSDVVSYTCQCAPFYTGPICETEMIIDNCLSKPCLNGGTCNTTWTAGRSGYVCACPGGFAGQQCQKKLHCNNNPCLNGGTCGELIGDVSGFICHCPRQFIGTECEIDMRPCTSSPCKHGAECVNRDDSYRCICPEGFKGKRCNKLKKRKHHNKGSNQEESTDGDTELNSQGTNQGNSDHQEKYQRQETYNQNENTESEEQANQQVNEAPSPATSHLNKMNKPKSHSTNTDVDYKNEGFCFICENSASCAQVQNMSSPLEPCNFSKQQSCWIDYVEKLGDIGPERQYKRGCRPVSCKSEKQFCVTKKDGAHIVNNCSQCCDRSYCNRHVLDILSNKEEPLTSTSDSSASSNSSLFTFVTVLTLVWSSMANILY